MGFNIKDVVYKPLEVLNDKIDILKEFTKKATTEIANEENNIIVDKLIRHLSLIDKYSKQIEAIDYLISNAEKLSGRPSYTTIDEELNKAIVALGGTEGIVTFDIFKKAVDIMLQTQEDMAILALTGKTL